MSNVDSAWAALWHPFQTGSIPWNGPYLLIRGRAGILPSAINASQIDCLQSFKPFSDALQKAGFSVIDSIQRTYSIVMVLPSPQRDEARALFARALQSITEDGVVLVSMPNNAGAKSGENDLRQLAPNLNSISKNKCRVFWADKRDVNQALLQEWLAFDEPRLLEDIGFISRPGIFAWDRIDVASKLLTDNLPEKLSGNGADLGAGLGYLTHTVLTRYEKVLAMDVFEAEARALECAKLNLAQFEVNRQLKYRWHDVAQGVQGSYDFVISNPPFHQGSVEVQTLGQAFIEAAAKSLRPEGRFYMVANRHLPYEAVLKKNFSQVSVLAMQEGFKVFEAIK
ncbi:MAG: class I SAM-dependent methyltransferase [Arenimonas sp.]